MDITDYSPPLRSELFGASIFRLKASRPALRRARRALIGMSAGLAGAVALAAIGGATYEAAASGADAQTYPPAGRLIDVGGHRLHLDCRGEGTPTVILDAGLGKSSLDWSLVQPKVAAVTRVCSYDRAGMGWSEPAAGLRSPMDLAAEFHTLLRNGGVNGPYVLVGHSLAGKNVRMFARAYPTEVAGMVLVDARSERIDAGLSATEVDGFKGALAGQAILYTVARRVGLARLFGASLLSDEKLVPAALAQQLVLLETAPNAVAATTAEAMARSANDAELAATTLGSMPLAVIAAKASMIGIAGWPEAQRALAALSGKGSLVVADTGHAVQLEQPDLVIDAVLSVLDQARRD
jgi:pimeloyl-ACP methyl ester carboxylesterase